MKKLLTTALLAIVTLAQASESFKFQAPINTQSNKTENELIKVRLPQELYPHLRYDLNDIRIATISGKSVAFSVLQDKEIIEEPYKRFYRATVDSTKLSDDKLLVSISYEKERIVSGIRINTPLRDFEFTVFVYTKNGEAIAENKAIFDYSSFTESRNQIINFAPRNLKSLNVVIKGLSKLQTQQLFQLKETQDKDGNNSYEKLSHINLQKPRFSFELGEPRSLSKSKPISQKVKKELVDWKVTKSGEKTVIRINTNKLPISQINILTNDQNFARQATIKAIDSHPYQRHIHTGTIAKWNYRKFHKNETSLNFTHSPSKQLELTIHNGSNTPISINDLEFMMPSHSLYFLEEPQKNYLMEFGNKNANHLHSQLPNALLKQGRNNAITSTIELNQYSTRLDHKKQQINSNYIIIPLIAIIFTFLIWTIANALKKAENKH